MKAAVLSSISVILFCVSCTKSKNQELKDGLYSGLSVLTMPLPRPYDSVGTTITLTFSGNRFAGTSDTTQSTLALIIGGGTYSVKSGHIYFTQDFATYPLNPNRPVLDGEYQLLKNSDSLVFAHIPDPKLAGAGTNYFRLRAN